MSAPFAGWPRPNPAVICLGMVAQDHIWTVDALPAGSGKSLASGFTSSGGGMAATAAVAVARLGGQAAFWGRAGNDQSGRLQRIELELEGVDVSNYRLFDKAATPVSGVLVDAEGDRMIINFRGGNLPASPDWLPLDALPAAGAVLADPRWPEGAARAFEAARAQGIPTVLDAEVSEPEVFELLLPLTDHAIFSEPSLARFAGSDDPLAKVAGYGCRVAAVTRGEKGVEWLENGQRHHLPAFEVPVIDTTGAGDVFHGAWALAVAAGATVRDAAGFAAAAAALKCTRPTGRSGIPTFDETVNLWRPNT